MKKLVAIALILLGYSCASSKYGLQSPLSTWDLSTLTREEIEIANKLLSYGLEHEALYTLLDTLKPISSSGFSLSYPIAKDSTMNDGDKDVVDPLSDSTRLNFDELKTWNKITRALTTRELTFLLIPYKQPWNGKRNLQLLVVRNSVFSKLLKRRASFFGQWGFTANANSATVLSVVEYENKNDRYRAYGYLFGYPEHAVDFFVEASITEEETGEFVKRNFFTIPVEAGNSGDFTYAVPVNYIPTNTDSTLYQKAIDRLEFYQKLKSQYRSSNGKLKAIKLLEDHYKVKH